MIFPENFHSSGRRQVISKTNSLCQGGGAKENKHNTAETRKHEGGGQGEHIKY